MRTQSIGDESFDRFERQLEKDLDRRKDEGIPLIEENAANTEFDVARSNQRNRSGRKSNQSSFRPRIDQKKIKSIVLSFDQIEPHEDFSSV